jgi:hypothetical protein
MTSSTSRMDERVVGRVYVQGLTTDNNNQIVILFDS